MKTTGVYAGIGELPKATKKIQSSEVAGRRVRLECGVDILQASLRSTAADRRLHQPGPVEGQIDRNRQLQSKSLNMKAKKITKESRRLQLISNPTQMIVYIGSTELHAK
jgi:hypothetical protein